MMKTNQPNWTKGSCLVYGRCSTEGQDASLADQYQTIERFVREAGLKPIAPPFEDDGRRGSDEERPGLRSILDYVGTHPNPVRANSDYIPIIVYNVARFGRFDDPKKLFHHFHEIERHGYEFYSVMEGLRSRGNIADFIQLIIRGEQAYAYTMDLSEYGIRTGCSLAEKGFWPGGNAPFGYDRMTFAADGQPRYRYVTRSDKTVEKYAPDGVLVDRFAPVSDKGKIRSAYSDKLRTEKVRLVPNPTQLVIVCQVFEWFVCEGWGLKKIARALNRKEVPAPRGRKWLQGSVRGVLLNPAHKGAVVYGRRSDGKHHDVRFEKSGTGFVPKMTPRDVARREFVHRPLSECVVIEGCHEPIVTREIWDQAQKKFDLRRRGDLGQRGKGARGSGYLLTGDGLMKCVHCGYHFHGSTDRKSRIRYYLDGGYHAGGREVCDLTIVAASEVEAFVLDLVERLAFGGRKPLFGDVEELASQIERELEKESTGFERPDPEREALEEKLLQVGRKREEAEKFEREFGQVASGLVNRLREDETGLERQIAEKKPASPAPMSPGERRKFAQEIARCKIDLKVLIEHGTPDERKQFIRSYVASIEVDGKNRKIRVGYYDPGEDVALRVMPPTGQRAEGRKSPLCGIA